RLSDLYACHSNLDSKKYLVEFNRIYLDYLYSANSIDQTLNLLERARELVDIYLSSDLLTELSDTISDLQLMTGGTSSNTTSFLIRAVRRIPTSEIAFSDNGKVEIQRAIYQLQKQKSSELSFELEIIQKMQLTGNYDFNQLKEIRKSLLVKVLPK